MKCGLPDSGGCWWDSNPFIKGFCNHRPKGNNNGTFEYLYQQGPSGSVYKCVMCENRTFFGPPNPCPENDPENKSYIVITDKTKFDFFNKIAKNFSNASFGEGIILPDTYYKLAEKFDANNYLQYY